MESLKVTGLSVAYEKKTVLEQISFSVEKGQLVGIVGPNGAGKSTLIKSILGLIPTLSGNVSIFGDNYEKNRLKVGYVPQRESVDWDFPTNALDVVMMGRYGHLPWWKQVGKKEERIALDALEKVGMAEYAQRQISQLSGGQQQRIFLARALVQNADLYFMDEPFVGVDAATEKAIISLLQDLKSKGKTVLVVHHDLTTVKEYFDYLLLINKKLVANGPVEEVFTPELVNETYGGHLQLFYQGSTS